MRGITGTVQRPLECSAAQKVFDTGSGDPRLMPIRLAQHDTGSHRLAGLSILHNSCGVNLKQLSLLFYTVHLVRLLDVGYPEAGESLIRRIARQRLLVRFHNQYLNQLVRGV